MEWGFPGGTWWRTLLPTQEIYKMLVQPLGWEDALVEAMETHSTVLAWEISWTEEPGWLPSMGLQRVGHNWSNLACTHTWYTNDTFFIACFIFLPWIWIFISWLMVINATPWVAGQWRKNTVLQRSFWNKINTWAWTANFAVLSLFFMLPSYHHSQYPVNTQEHNQLSNSSISTLISIKIWKLLFSKSAGTIRILRLLFACFNENAPFSPALPHASLFCPMPVKLDTFSIVSYVTLILFKDAFLMMIG